MSLYTMDSRIRVVDATLGTHPQRLHFVFEGTCGCFFLTPGLAFSLEDEADMQELGLLMNITGVMGAGWQSELLDKEVRLIVDFDEIDRTDFRIAVKAIGHKKEERGDDDHFIVLNSGLQLVSQDKAYEIITEENNQKRNQTEN